MTKPINVIITGGTGMAGSAVVRQAIADPEVGRVTVIVRRPLGIEHEKLRVIIHKDFNNYGNILSELSGHDVALWCLGITMRAVTKDEYHVITYDYAMAAVKAFAVANPDPSFKFLFLSGHGADLTEKSWVTFERVKGKTENALNRLGHPAVVSFRPGIIQPDVRQKPSMIRDAIVDFSAAIVFKVAPFFIINARDLAKGMLEVAKRGSDKQLLNNTEIQYIANEVSACSRK